MNSYETSPLAEIEAFDAAAALVLSYHSSSVYEPKSEKHPMRHTLLKLELRLLLPSTTSFKKMPFCPLDYNHSEFDK